MFLPDGDGGGGGAADGAPGSDAALVESGATAGAEAAGTGAAAGAAAAQSAPAPQTVPIERFRAVIGQRAEASAQLIEARRQLELANATIEEFKKLSEGLQGSAPQSDAAGGAAAPSKPAKGASAQGLSPAEIERLVAEEASRREFTRQCNDAFTAGKDKHADFEKVIADLNALSPVFDPRLQRTVMPQSLVEAALATGNAHEVLYALGKDNGLADRVFSLSPMQQAAELTKLALRLEREGGEEGGAAASAQQVSSAPKPVRPKVTGNGASAPVWDPANTESFSTAEWIAKREADLARQKATRH